MKWECFDNKKWLWFDRDYLTSFQIILTPSGSYRYDVRYGDGSGMCGWCKRWNEAERLARHELRIHTHVMRRYHRKNR